MGDHDDEGLAHDLPLLLGRRRLFGAVGAVGAEVYPSVEDATSASNLLRTSQLAFLEDSCRQAYEGRGYEASADNLGGLSLDEDGVFSDGYSPQLARVAGSVSEGYTATLAVPV